MSIRSSTLFSPATSALPHEGQEEFLVPPLLDRVLDALLGVGEEAGVPRGQGVPRDVADREALLPILVGPTLPLAPVAGVLGSGLVSRGYLRAVPAGRPGPGCPPGPFPGPVRQGDE